MSKNILIDECEKYKTVDKKKVKMTNMKFEKFKNKATGMIENLLEIMTIIWRKIRN